MADQSKDAESKPGRTGSALFYIMLGVIVALILLFLILRPKGSEAGAPEQKKSSIDVVQIVPSTLT